MTDYVVKTGDRIFVFGQTSMTEYRFVTDNKGIEQLELFKVWQGKFAGEGDRDRLFNDMKNTRDNGDTRI